MPGFSLELPGSVLVCGAAGAIGGSVCHRLVAAGVAVTGSDRCAKPETWRGNWIEADLADATAPAAISGGAEAQLGGVVLAAGVLDPAGWDAITPEEATRLIAINLCAPYFVLRALLPHLSDGASVVVVGSVAGMRASPATPFYAASKAGLRNLAASLAMLLEPRRIRVNVVAPGLIDTPLTDALNLRLAVARGVDVGRIELDRAAAIPMGRAGTADEVADTCLFLLSHQSSYTTGATLFATGGVLAGIV